MSQLPEPAFPPVPPGSTPEDQQLSPPLLSLSASIPLSRWSSDGARRAGGGSGPEGPRKPPGLRGVRWEGTPAPRGRAPSPPRAPGESPPAAPGPRPLRIPAAARGGDRREEGRAAEGRRRCVPRLPKADQIGSSAREPRLPARRPSAPPEPPPESRSRAGCPGAAPRVLPETSAPCRPLRAPPAAGPGGSAAVGDRGEEGRTVLRAVDAPPGRDSKL